MSRFGLRESDFKGKPGYWQKPKKIRKPGYGMVDGYEWGYRAPKRKQSKREISARELGEMIAPATREHAEKAAKDMETRGDVMLRDQQGRPQYVAKEMAESVQERTGWGRRPTFGFASATHWPQGKPYWEE